MKILKIYNMVDFQRSTLVYRFHTPNVHHDVGMGSVILGSSRVQKGGNVWIVQLQLFANSALMW